MKNILWILGLLFSVSLAVTSCEETEGVVDPYYKWQERNERYIDSIAQVAKANPDKWRVILSYKITPDLNNLQQKTSDYIYCRLLEKGEGTMKPIYTDSVVTHYRGKLIPLYNGSEVVFDPACWLFCWCCCPAAAEQRRSPVTTAAKPSSCPGIPTSRRTGSFSARPARKSSSRTTPW